MPTPFPFAPNQVYPTARTLSVHRYPDGHLQTHEENYSIKGTQFLQMLDGLTPVTFVGPSTRDGFGLLFEYKLSQPIEDETTVLIHANQQDPRTDASVPRRQKWVAPWIAAMIALNHEP